MNAEPLSDQKAAYPPIGAGASPAGPFERLLPRSIQGRLLLLLGVVLLPLLTVQASIYYDRMEQRKESRLQANLDVARVTATAFEGYVRDILRHELTVGSFLSLSQPLSHEQTRELLVESTRRYPSISELSWVGPDGKIVVSTSPRPSDPDVSQAGYFRALTLGRDWIVSELFQNSVTREPAFIIAQSVRDDKGALLGAMVAWMNPDRVSTESLPSEPADGDAVVIVDAQGRLVCRRPATSVTWGDRLATQHQLLLHQALAGAEATGIVVSVIDGRERISAAVPIRSIGWAICTNRPTAEAFAPVLQDARDDALLFALVALVALVVAVVLGRSITAPVKHLEQQILRFGRREQASLGRTAGPAELQSLAAGFQQMTEAIAGYEESLKASTSELRYKAAELEAIIENTDAQLALLDRDFNFVAVNSAYATGCGYARAELLGRNHFETFPNSENQAIFEQVRDTGNPFRARGKPFEYARRPEWSVTYWNWVLVPVRNEVGHPEALLLSLTDVTDQIRAHQWQEDILHMVSHDLRNPLTPIVGQSALLARHLQERGMEKEARSAEQILTSARRMNSMIEDLVESSRVETGGLSLHMERTGLSDLLRDSLERFGTAEDRARIRLECHEEIPPVLADGDRLERVLANLLTNALKYSPADASVIVRLELSDSEVRLLVKDSGVGIRPEERLRVFDRFYRATTGQNVKGLGLGLYIARLIVEAHGGRIWVESEVGKGSTFCVALSAADDARI